MVLTARKEQMGTICNCQTEKSASVKAIEEPSCQTRHFFQVLGQPTPQNQFRGMADAIVGVRFRLVEQWIKSHHHVFACRFDVDKSFAYILGTKFRCHPEKKIE